MSVAPLTDLCNVLVRRDRYSVLKLLTLLGRWEHGKVEPPQGSAIFQRISEQVERKVRDVRTLFRKFDENCDGTVSHKEFRDGACDIVILAQPGPGAVY